MVSSATEVQSAFCSVLSLVHVHRVHAKPSPIQIDDLPPSAIPFILLPKAVLELELQ